MWRIVYGDVYLVNNHISYIRYSYQDGSWTTVPYFLFPDIIYRSGYLGDSIHEGGTPDLLLGVRVDSIHAGGTPDLLLGVRVGDLVGLDWGRLLVGGKVGLKVGGKEGV